uniref:Deoxycytidylate deaminase n=1 Tax=Esox lucius TaxID=8010 RepID=A0A6Q2Z275_ESOLU
MYAYKPPTVSDTQSSNNYLDSTNQGRRKQNGSRPTSLAMPFQPDNFQTVGVGACIVNPENKIVGIGYNGMPNGCDDDLLPWSRYADDRLDTKYPYVCHAELNAIMNKNSADVKGCSMYVALFPCNECAKLIIQAGIKEVIYLSDKYHDTTEMTASRRLLNLAGIEYKQFKPKRNKIVIDFNSINHSGMHNGTLGIHSP